MTPIFFSRADANHPPEFVGLPRRVLLPENAAGLVLAIKSRDPDDGDNVTVHWAWERMEAVAYFIFEESSNVAT